MLGVAIYTLSVNVVLMLKDNLLVFMPASSILILISMSVKAHFTQMQATQGSIPGASTKKIVSCIQRIYHKPNWDNILGLKDRDAQTVFNTFSATFIKIYNQCFPIRTIKITHNNRLL